MPITDLILSPRLTPLFSLPFIELAALDVPSLVTPSLVEGVVQAHMGP
jgi:hypothetical protein